MNNMRVWMSCGGGESVCMWYRDASYDPTSEEPVDFMTPNTIIRNDLLCPVNMTEVYIYHSSR